jgi:hypothetical protein
VTRSWMDGLATTCPQPRGRGARPRGGGGGPGRGPPPRCPAPPRGAPPPPGGGGGGARVEVTPHGAQGGAPSVAGAAAEGGELAEARP